MVAKASAMVVSVVLKLATMLRSSICGFAKTALMSGIAMLEDIKRIFLLKRRTTKTLRDSCNETRIKFQRPYRTKDASSYIPQVFGLE